MLPLGLGPEALLAPARCGLSNQLRGSCEGKTWNCCCHRTVGLRQWGIRLSRCCTFSSGRGRPPTTVRGYEGWWNATPLSGDATGLPQETVAVNTSTGKVVDAFNRSVNDAGKVTNVSDVDYAVVPDTAWPADSVVIIETATGEVIESFPVNQNGEPINDAAGNSNRERPHGVKP